MGNIVVQNGMAVVGDANQNAYVTLSGDDKVIGRSIVVRILCSVSSLSKKILTELENKMYSDNHCTNQSELRIKIITLTIR